MQILNYNKAKKNTNGLKKVRDSLKNIVVELKKIENDLLSDFKKTKYTEFKTRLHLIINEVNFISKIAFYPMLVKELKGIYISIEDLDKKIISTYLMNRKEASELAMSLHSELNKENGKERVLLVIKKIEGLIYTKINLDQLYIDFRKEEQNICGGLTYSDISRGQMMLYTDFSSLPDDRIDKLLYKYDGFFAVLSSDLELPFSHLELILLKSMSERIKRLCGDTASTRC